MNYLECNHCNFKNTITTERMVFCKECGKKIDNNFVDWKKSKFDSSFETYIARETTENGEFIKISNPIFKEKENLFKRTHHFIRSRTSSEFKIFLGSTILQFMLCFILMNSPVSVNSSTNENKHYLNEVKWNNYSISQQISITLPFELKKSKSVLPEYLHNYLSYDKASKAESANSFSVTIEEFDVYEGINIDEKSYLTINDEYMQSPGTIIASASVVDHLKIKYFNSSSQYGSYTMNNKNYVYENYTLTKGNKAIKIIISYLDGDILLRKYADIVSQSLQNNIIA
ncbi:MAG: hypothetical protein H7141_03660 [Burkholderiales bacterium]|nr:hypothetical protein [Bacteroidia bacterium]